MFPDSETTVIGDPRTDINFRRQVHYEALGDYKTRIPEYIKETLASQKSRMGMPHENSFYLNSSDSLESLLQMNFEGKKVFTVSGSGEFSHAFISGGASEIISFDISPAAAFHSELRHVALCVLNMHDYIKLFSEWTGKKSYSEKSPFINADMFHHVESYLSDEARQYFQQVFQTPELINHGEDSWGGFSRTRFNKKTRDNRLIGDIITGETEYLALQEKARKASFTQVICDVNNLEELAKRYQPDVVYLSNIGYQPNTTIGIANRYIEQGALEVVCTICSNDTFFNDTYGRHGYDHRNFYFDDEKLGVGDIFTFPLSYEESPFLSTDVAIQVAGTDKNADYGLVLRLINPKLIVQPDQKPR